MKTVDFFGSPISKLILGDNPMNGHSYIGQVTPGEEMLDYYTGDNFLQALRTAERAGVNTLLALANDYDFRVWRQYKNEGGAMNLMFQSYPPMELEANLRQMMTYNPLAIYHQGGTADYMIEPGQVETLKERIRLIKSMGLPAGLGTHVPEVVIRAEEENWGCDFYMTCLYNARRQQRGQQSGFITGKAKDLVFYPEDKWLMFDVIKKVQKPCLVFKLLAGGQVFFGHDRSEYDGIVEREFTDAFSNMKPNDIGVIGVFQRDEDQLTRDAVIADKVLEKLG